jgi:hypothetical protein
LTGVVALDSVRRPEKMRISLSPFRLGLLVPVCAAAVACGGGNGLGPLTFINVVDTTVLYALHGTALTQPSGFDLVNNATRRIELAEPFDIAFDFDSTGAPVLYTAAQLGIVTGVGIQVTKNAFDAISRAPLDNYATDSLLTLSDSLTFIVHSRTASDNCNYLISAPRYGKFRVLQLDTATHSVTLQYLVDQNCGYIGLQPGSPGS